MKVARQFSKLGQSPYRGVWFRLLPDARRGVKADFAGMEVPTHWSLEAAETLVRKYFLENGVPARLSRVEESDVPSWLWRREADKPALATLPEADRGISETSARQVFNRIAGGWTYQGWKCGYFDSEQDARCFYDEIRAMLCRQIAAPDAPQWRGTGLYWAYGIGSGAEGVGCVLDYRTGAVTRAGDHHIPPHGTFLQDTSDQLVGEGGIMDLWQREARLLTSGLSMAANLSRVGMTTDDTDRPESQPGGLMRCLKAGDAAAESTGIPAADTHSQRLITVDAGHPEILNFTDAKTETDRHKATALAGARLSARHVNAIADACRRPGRKGNLDPNRNPALKFALLAARRAMLPETYIDSVFSGLSQNCGGHLHEQSAIISGDEAFQGSGNDIHIMRASDGLLDDVTRNTDSAHEGIDSAQLWDSLTWASWSSGRTGVMYSTTAEQWNCCTADGDIRTVAAEGDYLFLDDTACPRATINLAAFHRGDGGFDCDSLAHAVRLLTVALDISTMMTAQPTPRLAARTWDYRPLGLGFTNLAALLMSSGVAYDSDAGRAMCAAVAALITGTAYTASSEMAGELGCFPAHARNREAMTRVVQNHATAIHGRSDLYDGLTVKPVGLTADACPDRELAVTAQRIWDRLSLTAAETGFRNAQVTLVSPAEEVSVLLDSAGGGLGPGFSLVRFEKLPGGGFRKVISPMVAHALKALGYEPAQIDSIILHVAGFGTLRNAPGINHESLRRRGFDEAALKTLEGALATTLDVAFVFNKWILGEAFCTQALGFTVEELDDDGFDILAALGFSDSAIEAANIYCCGTNTMEGAAELEPQHLSVFDCPRARSENGWRRLTTESLIRMMAAAQPFVSGGVGHSVTVPNDATVEAVKTAYLLGWKLGLKSLLVEREDSKLELPAAWHADAVGDSNPSGLADDYGSLKLLDGGQPVSPATARAREVRVETLPLRSGGSDMSQAMRIARIARELAQASRGGDRHKVKIGTCSGDEAPDAAPAAETSRQSALDAPRSTASAPSSADAIVEQRQV